MSRVILHEYYTAFFLNFTLKSCKLCYHTKRNAWESDLHLLLFLIAGTIMKEKRWAPGIWSQFQKEVNTPFKINSNSCKSKRIAVWCWKIIVFDFFFNFVSSCFSRWSWCWCSCVPGRTDCFAVQTPGRRVGGSFQRWGMWTSHSGHQPPSFPGYGECTKILGKEWGTCKASRICSENLLKHPWHVSTGRMILV